MYKRTIFSCPASEDHDSGDAHHEQYADQRIGKQPIRVGLKRNELHGYSNNGRMGLVLLGIPLKPAKFENMLGHACQPLRLLPRRGFGLPSFQQFN